MKVNFILLLVLLISGACWMVYSAQSVPINTAPDTYTPALQNLETAPDFSYTSLFGAKGTLRDHKGKVVLLHFWASWCAPCLVEFPDLTELARAEQDNFIVLAVSTDDKVTDIEKFLTRTKIEVPVNMIIIQDEDKSISQDLYQSFKLPETYLITHNQDIMEKIVGPQDNWNSPFWHEKINAAMKNTNISE